MGWGLRLWVLGGLAAWTQRRRAAAAAAPRDSGEGGRRRDLELRLVQVVFRHGARTPLRPIPGAAPVSSACGGTGRDGGGAGGAPSPLLSSCPAAGSLCFGVYSFPEAIPRVVSEGKE